MAKAGANAEWKAWGEHDPLYGVASWTGRQATGESPWKDDEFYELGRSDWDDFRRRWEQYGLTAGSCVEIGCGAGRLTLAMTEYFEEVHGVDVSEGMLRRAKGRAHDAAGVTFHLTDGLRLPLPDASVDAAISTHVFQHFDTYTDALQNIKELSRVLTSGGTLMLHLPIHLWPTASKALQRAYEVRLSIARARAIVRRVLMRLGLRGPMMRGRSFLWQTLVSDLESAGFKDVEMAIFRVTSNGGHHPVVFATRA